MWSNCYDELLDDMLAHQRQYLPAQGFLGSTAIPACVHQRLADWMLETCEDFRCDSDVFASAITFMDRFIAVTPNVRVEDLALIGFTCIFLAVKQSGKVIRATTLCTFLGNSFTESQLKAKEVAILSALDWRLDAPKPHDFLDQFLQRLPFLVKPEEMQTLKVRSEVFVDMCYCDASFVMFGPAVIAAAALYCAIVGIDGDNGTAPMYDQIPPAFQTTCFGLAKFFPDNGDATRLVSAISTVKCIFRTYHSEPVSNNGHAAILQDPVFRG